MPICINNFKNSNRKCAFCILLWFSSFNARLLFNLKTCSREHRCEAKTMLSRSSRKFLACEQKLVYSICLNSWKSHCNSHNNEFIFCSWRFNWTGFSVFGVKKNLIIQSWSCTVKTVCKYIHISSRGIKTTYGCTWP